MAYLIAVPLLALLAALQSSLVSHLRLLDGRPDLVLLTVVAWGLVAGTRSAMAWGLIGGLFLDSLTGVPFGTSTLALTVIGYLTSIGAGRFWQAHLLMPLAATLVASAIFYGAEIGALLLSGRSLDLSYAGLRVVLPGTFLNLVLALPASQLAEGLHRALFPPQVTV
ncbi:MAG: rod shape-determining protein MreD [Chloroflexota bacterium]